MAKRIEIIGQNGNEGEHYAVIDVAREIADYMESNPDNYATYMDLAIDVINILRETKKTNDQ